MCTYNKKEVVQICKLVKKEDFGEREATRSSFFFPTQMVITYIEFKCVSLSLGCIKLLFFYTPNYSPKVLNFYGNALLPYNDYIDFG